MSEAFSRVIIDQKLKDAGWDLSDPSQVVFEDHGIAGRADYVLKDKHGRAVALIEAKKPEIDPYIAKQQALNYAETQYKGQIDYIYLANDHIIYFWDYNNSGDAEQVEFFFSQEDLSRKKQAKLLGNTEPLTQKTLEPEYFQDIDPEIKLRPYQIQAFNSIAKEYDTGKRKFLLEMATGTGKTLLASAIISKFIRTNQAQTVLFVVDRIELAAQTKGVFERFLGNMSVVATYWGGSKRNLTGANIVVATIQSLIAHGRDTFTPGYFDLVIHDEAHRSIYSPEARGAMDYFTGTTKIGLTATPRDFLKNMDLDELSENDPRKVEARIQRDTYTYFDCKNSTATFRYTIQDGVNDGYLVPAKLHKMNSRFTQQALSDQGLVFEGEFENESFKISQLERKIFLPGRNKLMMEEFLEYADKNQKNELGKTLVFAVNQKHAIELAKILNSLKPEYGGRFASVVTSWVKDAHEIARDFKKLDNSMPRVAVSVDMLTTGYDAPEVQNIVLARPVFEPTLYQQIKGRGTRPCQEIDKENFTIFDFCGVCEYFEEKYDWEAPLADPHTRQNTGTQTAEEESEIAEKVAELKKIITASDSVEARDQIVVGPEGDKVDRELYQDEWTKLANKLAEEMPEIAKLAEDDQKTDKLEEELSVHILNKPNFYFNEDNLIKSHRVVASLRDFFLSALGKKKLPNRDTQLDEWRSGLLNKYGQSEGATQKRYLMAKLVIDQVSKNPELFHRIDEHQSLSFLSEAPFSLGFSAEEWLETFKRDELKELIIDIKNSKVLRV